MGSEPSKSANWARISPGLAAWLDECAGHCGFGLLSGHKGFFFFFPDTGQESVSTLAGCSFDGMVRSGNLLCFDSLIKGYFFFSHCDCESKLIFNSLAKINFFIFFLFTYFNLLCTSEYEIKDKQLLYTESSVEVTIGGQLELHWKPFDSNYTEKPFPTSPTSFPQISRFSQISLISQKYFKNQYFSNFSKTFLKNISQKIFLKNISQKIYPVPVNSIFENTMENFILDIFHIDQNTTFYMFYLLLVLLI